MLIFFKYIHFSFLYIFDCKLYEFCLIREKDQYEMNYSSPVVMLDLKCSNRLLYDSLFVGCVIDIGYIVYDFHPYKF